MTMKQPLMSRSLARKASAVAALGLTLGLAQAMHAGARSPQPNAAQKGTPMTRHATGAFDVKITPLALGGPAEDAALGRMSIEKQFHGDLEATGKGQMLTAATDVKGSAAYVAMERVSGTLHGRSGAFALVHRGTMDRGEPRLEVTVVPDSGTGQLAGLAGRLTIVIAGGKHSYDLEYTLP
jgi:hypothetical protein